MAVRIACECDDTALMPNACLSAFMDLFLRRCLSLLCGTHCECFRCIIDCCENMHWVGDSIVEDAGPQVFWNSYAVHVFPATVSVLCTYTCLFVCVW